METDFSTGQHSRVSFLYRLVRAVVRVWTGLFFRRIRALNPESVPDPAAVLIVVSHPASFLDALLLIAALQRQVRCYLPPQFLRGPARGLLGWLLGMVRFEQTGEESAEVIGMACDLLAKGQAVLFFVEEVPAKPGEAPHFSPIPAVIAMRAEARTSGQLGMEILPVHLFLPVAQLYSSEVLVHVGAPLIPREYLAKGGNMSEQARLLAAALEEACRQNVFRLHSGDIHQFLADLEEIFRADVAETWAARPNWKQKLDGFGLSRFIAEWVEQLNGLHPGQLVALRDLLDSYRETHRRCSLDRLEVDQAGAWIKATWRRLGSWMESALGLPVALYGFINHLVACLILYRVGLLSRDTDKNVAARWVGRVLVVGICYAAQIMVCDLMLGRIVAGYYALTLLPSGLYFLRYLWLVRNRTRPLFLDLRARREASKLLRMRRSLVQEINAARNGYAERLGLAH